MPAASYDQLTSSEQARADRALIGTLIGHIGIRAGRRILQRIDSDPNRQPAALALRWHLAHLERAHDRFLSPGWRSEWRGFFASRR